MNPFSVTPVASLLSSCVAKGVVSQEEIDSAPRERHSFSLHLLEAERQMKSTQLLGQLQLETELLRLEKRSADVTHKFYLTQRFQALQLFTGHLQEVLREQSCLRQRLMKPFCQSSLPIEAHLHRYVVDVMRMVVDFIENLEHHMTTVQTLPSLSDNMAKLNKGLTQLLVQVTAVEKLSQQVLQYKGHHSSLWTDSSV